MDQISAVKVYTFDDVAGVKNWMGIIDIGKACSEETRQEVEK